jgi:hypothetical protein
MTTTRRQERYATLTRGWSWRTTPERLQKAQALADRLGISKTELLERAIDLFIKESTK